MVEYCYAECHFADIIMLCVVMLSVVMLCVVMLSVASLPRMTLTKISKFLQVSENCDNKITHTVIFKIAKGSFTLSELYLKQKHLDLIKHNAQTFFYLNQA